METCNGLDDDCDGEIDEDAVDQRVWYPDRDGDGFGDHNAPVASCEPAGLYVAQNGDCDDADAAVYPTAEEDPCTDTGDMDCDGLLEPVDADGDGWDACNDCDDAE